MHSSISLGLDSGVECGAPGGRDLYTFVTSAAGHMMRTLQKPRKNRPSKRQVNHRRFLHNMIQRKFADIEAANHRLASVLYFKVDEKKPDAPEPAPNPSSGDDSTRDEEMSKDCDPRNTLFTRKTNEEPTSKPSSKKRKFKKSDQNVFDFTSPGSAFTETMHLNDFPTDARAMDEQIDLTESNFFQWEPGANSSPPFSPELSPLSLDSCDFSVQMFTDVSPSAQENSGELVETQWTDIYELFSKELRESANLETCLDSFYDHQREQGDFLNERRQCRFNCNRESQDVTNDSTNGGNVIQHEAQFPVGCPSHQNLLHQDQSTGRSEPVPFEGIARSFSAPSQNVPRFSIATPPHEGDWLFTDILTDNTASRYRHVVL